MNKREFLTLSMVTTAATALAGKSASSKTQNTIDKDGVSFAWRHDKHRLTGRLSAPTKGWIAVGFNETARLQNTRFVIAAVSQSPIRAEEHLAVVPAHRRVDELGLSPALLRTNGRFENGISYLTFTLSDTFPGRPGLKLAPGNEVGVMLAWSHETDFGHHSAWRRHFTITL